MYILNFIAWDLQIRILFEISVFFSVSYFVMAIGQIIHIIFNHYNPNKDWGKKVNKNSKHNIWKTIKNSSLFKTILINGILLILLVIIFPILHI